jgi:cell division protein FtsN
MRALRQPPPNWTIHAVLRGGLAVLAVIVLLVGCGPPPKAKPKEAAPKSVAPTPPLESLDAKVRGLEEHQSTLMEKRAQLEGEFARLTEAHQELAALRDDVLAAQREAAERAASLEAVKAETLEQQRVAKLQGVFPPTPGGPGTKPFVVHTASFRSPELALKEAARLTDLGYAAYTVRVDLGRKGVWYRLLVDRFGSDKKAKSFARSLKERTKLTYAAPMRLPYAVDLGGYASMEEARGSVADLGRKGIHPYIVKDRGDEGSTIYRLRLGAYKRQAEAEAAAERAGRAGVSSAVVKP